MIEQRAERRLQAFGSSCHLVIEDGSIDGSSMLDLATDELLRIEEKLSSYRTQSAVYQLNEAAGTGATTELDRESQGLFQYATALWQQSNHQFDPTTEVLNNCYTAEGDQMATGSQLQAMLQLVGWQHLSLDDSCGQLPDKGMLVNLDSCVRAYALDSVIRLWRRNGANHGLVELDRDAASLGTRPDGTNWMTGVRHPARSGVAITRLKLNDRGLTVRGDFERHITRDGERFGWGLSPVDGHPVPGPLSVTVIAETCLEACAAASLARLKTEQAAIAWLEELGLPWFIVDRQLECIGPLAPAK